MSTVLTGVGLALPGVSRAHELLDPTSERCAVIPAQRLGRRGLRYRDRATQLALCAAIDAARDAGLLDAADALTVPGETVATVSSSNRGNLDTVCRVAEQIADDGVRAISPMGLPNASSNVVAASVAIRLGLRGPNLMLCNGETSGLDAVHWADTLIRAGRAERVLVVGVEAPSAPAARLCGGGPLLDGAAAVVVEDEALARARGARALATIGRYGRGATLAACLARLGTPRADFWLGSRGSLGATGPGVIPLDLEARFGAASGALGVLECAAGVGWLAGAAGTVLATTGDAEASSVLVLSPAGVS